MNMLQDYSHIVVSRHTENVPAVSVEMQTSDELRSTVLMLRVCACRRVQQSAPPSLSQTCL